MSGQLSTLELVTSSHEQFWEGHGFEPVRQAGAYLRLHSSFLPLPRSPKVLS